MQPTIIVTAPVPGMIYLNGRFAGECSAERPLFAPVPPWGAVYLEYRPLAEGAAPLARRWALAEGTPVPESLAEAEGLACVAWPGGALEVEIALRARRTEAVAPLEGRPCVLERGPETSLSLGGARVALPEGALPPRLIRAGEFPALLGELEDGGQYLATLNPGMDARTGLLTAARIDAGGGGMIHAMVDSGDLVGHGRLEQWFADAAGLHRVSSEPVWSHGAPRWPRTAEETLRAAVEAALAGQQAESDGYLTPALAAESPLRAVGEVCDLCVPMRYGLPDPRVSVGLLRVENAHLAGVRPLYCRAVPGSGNQGPWAIEHLTTQAP